MTRPTEWKGSDLRARGEVAQWLRDHGDEVHDPTGLLVGRMREELGKGRALSQLLADMERDGMIAREVRGRRTLMLKLLDDWGLIAEQKLSPTRRVTPGQRSAVDRGSADIDLTAVNGDVDLEQLANTLLAVVLKRAQPQASRGAELEKMREQRDAARGQLREARDALILAREAEAEQRRQADAMRESLAKLQRNMDKPKRGGGAPLADQLDPASKRLLADLRASLAHADKG